MAEVIEALRRVFGGGQAPTLEQLAAERQDFLNEAADMGADRVERYHLYEEYFSSERRVPLLARARLFLERSGLPYTEHPAEAVVLAHKSRLRVEGFEVEDNEAASDWLTRDFWGRGRMDGVQGIVHLETLKLGDGFLILDWDDEAGRPCARWNDPRRIKPVYDDGELEYVAKVWNTSATSPSNPQGRDVRRLNLYYPDRVEKWFATSRDGEAVWAPYLDADDFVDQGDNAEPNAQLAPRWPTPWTQTDGSPLGIPVFHFREQAGGGDFGRSILRTVIPQFDALDKQGADLFYVMDAQGWKQRWASGIEEGTALSVAVGEWVKGPVDAKFGEFAAEDPIPLQEIIEGTFRRIAVKSRTPLHELLIKGDPPSGEMLKTAEGAAIAATEDRHVDYGNTWEDVGRMAHRLAVVFGDGAPVFDDTAEVTALWKDPRTRNEKDEAATLLVHQELGASKATTLRRAGYDPEQEATLRAAEGPVAPPPPAPGDPVPPAGPQL